MLVFIDVFSGYVKLFKLKTKDTIGVCRAFENLTCLIGPPRLLTSDNGNEFTSELLQSMCKVQGAAKRTSVTYRPQSQGNVERFNRTLIADLRKRLDEHGKSWVDHLQYVEWAYNTTPRSNSEMTPYLLMYGREPPLPTFVDVDEKVIADKDLRKFFEGHKARTKEVYDEARRRMILKREKEVKAYEKIVKHNPLEPGDIAYEEVPESLRNKLQPKWKKLKVVKRHTGPKGDTGTTYDCEKPDGSTCTRNYEQLKLSKMDKNRHEDDNHPPAKTENPPEEASSSPPDGPSRRTRSSSRKAAEEAPSSSPPDPPSRRTRSSSRRAAEEDLLLTLAAAAMGSAISHGGASANPAQTSANTRSTRSRRSTATRLFPTAAPLQSTPTAPLPPAPYYSTCLTTTMPMPTPSKMVRLPPLSHHGWNEVRQVSMCAIFILIKMILNNG